MNEFVRSGFSTWKLSGLQPEQDQPQDVASWGSGMTLQCTGWRCVSYIQSSTAMHAWLHARTANARGEENHVLSTADDTPDAPTAGCTHEDWGSGFGSAQRVPLNP